MKRFVELDNDLVSEWREHPVTRAFVKTMLDDYAQLKRRVMGELAAGQVCMNLSYVGGEIYAWREILRLATGDIHE